METRGARANPIALVAMALGLLTSQVSAQAPHGTQASNQTSADLQEVLVSATKRLEEIQEIPLSVTALSAAQLEAKVRELDAGSVPPRVVVIGILQLNL